MNKPSGKQSVFSFFPAAAGLFVFVILCILLKVRPDRLIGAAFCHQIAARSPSPDFPYCYRCCGLFFGIFWGILTGLTEFHDQRLISVSSVISIALSLLLFLTDALNAAAFIGPNWYPDRPILRFLSALPFGFWLADIMLSIYKSLFDIQTGWKISYPGKLICMAGGCAFSTAVIFSARPAGLVVSQLMIPSGNFFFLFVLYAILIKCIAMLNKKTCGIWNAVPDACFFAFLQICLFGGLHIAFFHFDLLLQ